MIVLFCGYGRTGRLAGAEKKTRRTDAQKEAKRRSDNSRSKTRVDISCAFNRISGDQGFETDYEMAVFLLDRYVIFIVLLNNFEGCGFAIYVVCYRWKFAILVLHNI